MMKKFLVALSVMTFVVFSATPAIADDEPEVELKTGTTATVLAGETAWVVLSWTAEDADATGFRVVATTQVRGVTISYPVNTGDHTSLMDNDTLSEGEIDFTALQISVPHDRGGNIRLNVEASWMEDGEREDDEFSVQVRVARWTGDDIGWSSDDAGSVSVGEPGWLGVAWTGIAPSLTNVQMSVSGPEGIIIGFPEGRGGRFTSLHFDSTLVRGETDVARFHVDASGLEPGTYSLRIELVYNSGPAVRTIEREVTFAVTN